MLKSMARRLMGGGRATTARFALPPVVLEIAPGFMLGASLEGSKRKGRKVRKLALRSLNAASLDPHLSHANIAGSEDFGRAAAELISAVGNGDGRFGLLLPDGAVRVALLSFESLPEGPEAAEALIRWRMRDKLPFNAEEARVTYQVLSAVSGQIEILALAIRNSVVEEYESAFAGFNAKSVLMLPTTVALLPLLPEQGSGAQVLIHVCGNWLTVVVMSGSIPCAWRTRELDSPDGGHYEREIAAESARLVASARERGDSEVGSVWLCVRPAAEKSLAGLLSETMEHEVSLMRPPSDLTSLLGAEDRSRFEQFGAPIAGLVANEN